MLWDQVKAALNAIYQAGEDSFVAGTQATPWGVTLTFSTWDQLLVARDFASRQQDGRTWATALAELESILKADPAKFYTNSVSTPDGFNASYGNWEDFMRIYWFVKGKADEEAGTTGAAHAPIGLRLKHRRRY